MSNLHQHSEYFKGELYAYGSETFDGLVMAVTRGRANQGRRANYNNVYNELQAAIAMGSKRTITVPKNPAAAKFVSRTNKAPGEKVTAKEAISGAKSVLNAILGKSVDQKTIDERAKICLNCPKLSHVIGCQTCGMAAQAKELWNAAQGLWGRNYEVPTLLKKTSCSVCKCASAAILPAPLSDFADESPFVTANRPANCWVKVNRNG